METIRNSVRTWLGITDPDHDEFIKRQEEIALQRDYRLGNHRRTLKVKYMAPDDNVFVNFCGLVIDRSISGLFGEGITFQIDDEDSGNTSAEQEYIDALWRVNKLEILLHNLALYACESGTGYIKIIPDAIEDKDGKKYPRLVALDPLYMTMETTPHDCDTVIRYIIRYNYVGADGKPVAFKEVTEFIDTPPKSKNGKDRTGYWEVATFEDRGAGWMETNREKWDYNFPPIIHWQNLPNPGSPYGESDITDDVIMLQDKLNYIASNEAKIIRYHAHPKTYTINASMPSVDSTGKKVEGNSWDPDQMLQFNSTVSGDNSAKIANLEMQSDLASTQDFFMNLRQALFDITRTVDIDSIPDKLGALTNFGLRVLYQDAQAKLHTKQELYGNALIELNSRLLTIAGMDDDGGSVLWRDTLPENGLELSSELQADMNMGILDKQSAAEMKGYDWELIQSRLENEQTSSTTIGEQLVRQFMGGQQ